MKSSIILSSGFRISKQEQSRQEKKPKTKKPQPTKSPHHNNKNQTQTKQTEPQTNKKQNSPPLPEANNPAIFWNLKKGELLMVIYGFWCIADLGIVMSCSLLNLALCV